MKQVSNKWQKLFRKYCQPRKDFRDEYGFCWVCGRSWQQTVHEMAKGIHRERAYSQRVTWLVACAYCNFGPLNDYALWPLERQLALKWIYDYAHFDLVEFNLIRGRDPLAIVFGEVVPWICRQLDGEK